MSDTPRSDSMEVEIQVAYLGAELNAANAKLSEWKKCAEDLAVALKAMDNYVKLDGCGLRITDEALDQFNRMKSK